MATTQQISRFWSWHRNAAPAGTAVERVYVSVSSRIVSGTLAAGSLITEGEMAELFNVSRTPVREAFLVLESQGLLRLFPKKGAIVTTPAPEDAEHLLQVRIMLESRAVGLQTAGSITDPVAAADLFALIDVQREAAARSDALAFAHADHQFHARIVAGSGNPIIDDFYAQLGPRLARLTCLTVRRTAELQRFVDEHEQLAVLHAAADHRGYEDLLQTHVTGS